MSKPGYKKSFEYLFLSLDPDKPDEFYHVLEKGYRPPQENEALGLVPFAGLYSTVYGADMARINTCLRKQFLSDIDTSDPNLRNRIATGSLLVCKVVMIKPQVDPIHPTFDPNTHLADIYKTAPISQTLTNNPDVVVTYRDSSYKDGKLEHRLYFIHEHTLILPEYMVDFNYETKDGELQAAHIGHTLAVLSSPSLTFCKPGDDKLPDNRIDHVFKSKIEELKSRYSDPKYRSNSALIQLPTFRASNSSTLTNSTAPVWTI